LNKATPEEAAILKDELEKTGLPLVGIIPADRLITEYDAGGKALFDLPENAPAAHGLFKILDELKV
jgi:CO dehydrogenase maturation factor